MAAILAVDDEIGIREFVMDALADAGHDVKGAGDGAEAFAQLEDRPFDLLLVDLRMPGGVSGLDVLRRARAEWPDMQVIVLTAHGSVGTAVEAMKLGAFDFIEKPIAGPAELRKLVARALNWGAAQGPRRSRVAEGGLAQRSAGARLGPNGGSTQRIAVVVRSFLWQLKRRHVYNVAATYAAAAFIILQAAELVLPVLPFPGWLYSVLAGLVIAGFPVALVLGWIYDISATGLRRTRGTLREAR
jgi:DNA-binding response OmpR family regulator